MPMTLIQAGDCGSPSVYRRSADVTVEMAENRSTIPQAARVVVLLWAIVAGAIAVVATALGAWPIGVLELVVVGGLWLAFARAGARPPRREWLILSGDRARHLRMREDGSIEEWAAPRACTRVRHASAGVRQSISLSDRNRSRVVGLCLTDAERGDLAGLLAGLLPGSELSVRGTRR